MSESPQYATIKLLSFVKSFYNVPRFGRSKDISFFFANDASTRSEYMWGLIIVFSFIMGAAALWFFILLILRLLGPRAGCSSGNASTIPAESMMSKGSYSVHTDETGEFIVMQGDQNRVNRTRIVYFISGLYTACGCGFLAYGLIMMMNSLTSFYNSAEDILSNVDADKIDNLLTIAGEFIPLRDNLVVELSSYCTAPAVGTVHGANPAIVIPAFAGGFNAIPDITTDSTWSSLSTDVTDLEALIQSMVSFLGYVNGPITVWFLVAVSAVGLLFLFSLYMIACAWKSGKEGYQFVGEERRSCGVIALHYFVTPFFAILLATAWFSTSVLFTSQTANADFCYDEIVTGDTVLRLLVQRGYTETTDAYILVDAYLHDCSVADVTPLTPVNELDVGLNTVAEGVSDFQDLYPDGDITELTAACGATTSTIVTNADTAIEKFNELKAGFESIQGSISCETMAPIMQGAVYENSCNNLSQALLWSFVSGLCVSFFGTIMLTLRSATLRPQIFIVTPNPAASRADLEDDSSFGY